MLKQILVIEDDSSIRELLTEALRECGYQATATANGAKALELVANKTFDLITTDLHFPEGDGNQLLDELSRHTPQTPVIVVSDITKALKPHCQVKAIVSKPFDLDKLLAVVDENAK